MKIKKRRLPPVPEEMTQKPWKVLFESDWVVYILVALVGALTYANSFNGEFVHDDISAIVSNRDVNGWNSVYKLLENDFWGTPMSDITSHKSYRPLTTLTFRLNYLVCGLAPWWWHACNVVLHAICCVLVARSAAVVARLRRPFAALASLLFAVHPIHTEAVSGIVGRADVLACVFFLSSVLLYHGSSSRPRVWSSVALAALSMLAKETGLTVVLFNVTLDLYRCWGHIHKNTRSRLTSKVKWRYKCNSFYGRLLRVAAATLLLVVLRLALLQGSLPIFSPQDNLAAFHSSTTVRALTFLYLAAFNWWLLLCPWSLSHDWQVGSVPLVLSAWDPRNLLTCGAFITLLAISYRCLRNLGKPSPAVVGLLLLVIPYLPASNLLVTVGFVVAERVLYIPSVGSVILTAYGVQLIWRRASGRRLVVLSVAVLVAAGALRTHLRNKDWLNRETLLRADLAVLPHNAKLHFNFANFLKDVGQREGAVKHYQEALNLWPSYASAHNNLGTLMLATAAGQAEQHFIQALNYNKNHVNAHFNLAQVYRKKNWIPEALVLLERCITLGPHFILAYFELLTLKPEKRRWIMNQLHKLEPGNWEPFMLYGNWMKDRGLLPIAMQYYLLGMRTAFASDSPHGKLVTLRVTSSALRTVGQQARIVQLISRWHTVRNDRAPAARRESAARARRLRVELAAKAAHYDRSIKQGPVTSTCIHHSQLEDSPESIYHLKPPTDITNIIFSTTDPDTTNITLPTANTDTTNTILLTANTDAINIKLPTASTDTSNITLPTAYTKTTITTLSTAKTNTNNTTLSTTNTEMANITFLTADPDTKNITLPTAYTNMTNTTFSTANTDVIKIKLPTNITDKNNITLPTANTNRNNITLPTAYTNMTNTYLSTANTDRNNITLPTTNTDRNNITLLTVNTNTSLSTANTDAINIKLPTTNTDTNNITLLAANTETTITTLSTANTDTYNTTLPIADTNNIKSPTASTDTTDITLPTPSVAKPVYVDKTNKICCQKNYTEKSVSIRAQYKHTLNKFKSAQKQNSCPLLKKKVNDLETFAPIPDHNIKTY